MLPRPAPGRLYVVATPIGNLEDITLRALRVLREVRVIAAEDTRRTARLLAHAGIDTPMVSLHAHNESARLPALLERLRLGEPVALVTDAGTSADPAAAPGTGNVPGSVSGSCSTNASGVVASNVCPSDTGPLAKCRVPSRPRRSSIGINSAEAK